MNCIPGFFVATSAELRNLEKTILWGHEDFDHKVCAPYDRLTGEGCQWWTETTTPSLDTCRSCIRESWFCRGCTLRDICPRYPYPKVFPSVSRFLTRMNIADHLHQQIYPPHWQDIPLKEWQLLVKAIATKNIIEGKLRKRIKQENKSYARGFR